MEFPYYAGSDTTIGTAEAPRMFKFDLVAQNDFTTRTVPITVTSGNTTTTISVQDLNEGPNHWMGRTVSGSSTTGDPPVTTTESRLIVGSGTGELMVSHAFSTSFDTYWIDIEEVPAYEDQTAHFQYGIFRRNVTTDKIGPIISGVSPGKSAVVQDGDIMFQADVIDVSSGYSSDEDNMEEPNAVQNGWVALEILGNIIPGKDITWTKIDDGWRMEYENSFGTPGSVDPITWRIIARDRAGAQTIEDRTGSSRITVDGKKPGGPWAATASGCTTRKTMTILIFRCCRAAPATTGGLLSRRTSGGAQVGR